VEAGVSLAYFKLMDREGIFQIAVMDSPEPILGVTVFEGLGIRIDPVTGKLEYSRPYGLSAIYAISSQKLHITRTPCHKKAKGHNTSHRHGGSGADGL
jgi:hypothetical protein